MIVGLAACCYYVWDSTIKEESSIDEAEDKVSTTYAPIVEPIAKPSTKQDHQVVSKLQGMDAEVSVEPSPYEYQRDVASIIRETLEAQRSIIVPHDLDNAVTLSGSRYRNAVVFRIEPDGINIRHDEGISKIPKEEMPYTWRERYHMDTLVAEKYRARRSEREREARRAAMERQRSIEEQRRQVLQEGHLSAEQRRLERQRHRDADNIARRREAWRQYDRELAEWNRRDRMYEYTRRRVVRSPRPAPPPFPRP